MSNNVYLASKPRYEILDGLYFKSLPLEKQEELRKKYDFWKYQG